MDKNFKILESEEEFVENQEESLKLFFLKIEELFLLKAISFKHVLISLNKEIVSWILFSKFESDNFNLEILKKTLIENEDFLIINNKPILFLEKRKINKSIIAKIIEKIKYFFNR